MQRPIRGNVEANQRQCRGQSEAIRQRSSEVISGHQRPFVKGHERSSAVIRGHSSEAIHYLGGLVASRSHCARYARRTLPRVPLKPVLVCHLWGSGGAVVSTCMRGSQITRPTQARTRVPHVDPGTIMRHQSS